MMGDDFWQPTRRTRVLWPFVVALGIVVALLCLWAGLAYADPPPGTNLDTPLHRWFSELKEPNYPSGCCGYHKDCWETDAKKVNGVWYAYYHPDRDSDTGWWITVPQSASYVEDDPRLPQGFNMAVRAVLCAAPGRKEGDETVYCFVPPASTF